MQDGTRYLEPLATTLDSLLCYTNRRFHVVRDACDLHKEEERSRSELLERFLWNHRELIGDFVRENPDNLSPALLEIASELAGTLYGTLYLEEFGCGMATVLHETGAYRVTLPSESFAEHFPEGPLELRGALAPYRGGIVPLPPFSVMGRMPSSTIAHLHANLTRQGLGSPTGDARVLFQRTNAWLAECAASRTKVIHHPIEQLGRGFHRGVLAGLDQERRDRAQQEHANRLSLESGQCERVAEVLRLDVDGFPVTLEEALQLLDTDWLNDIALEMGDTPVPPALPRDEIVQWIRRRLIEHPGQLDTALVWCLDEQFDLIGRLLETNPLPFDGLDPTVVERLYPMIPYVFILHEGTSSMAWMPPEVRSLITQRAYDAARVTRRRLSDVYASARMLATMCGIISVSDVYERYRRCVSDPLDRRHFEMALEDLQACDTRDDYALWRHLGTDYVISVEISDESAPARVTRESYPDRILDPEATGLPNSPIIVGLSERDESEFSRLVAQNERELERARLSLLACDRTLPPPDLSPHMLQGNPTDVLMRLGPLRSLRSFVDAHVPDDQDDYEFADLFVRSVVVSVVLMAESYNDTMDLIRLYHMQDCDGTGFSDTLGRLMTNAYNALPRWELNGWSLEQSTERITGRRRFFNDDGTTLSVDDEDGCPCGSGRPYGQCCGHLPLERKVPVG